MLKTLWIVLGLCVSPWLLASETGKSPHARVTLISENQSVQPEHEFYVGLYFQLDPHWHVYWRNPGDSGEPPKVQWQLPEGYSAGEVLWPIPKKMNVGPLLNYGYENQVLLMVPIRPTVKALGLASIQGTVSWLVCREECLPGKAQLEIQLPVKNEIPKKEPRWQELFLKTREELPRSLPQEWKLEGRSSADFFSISMTLSKKIKDAFFLPFEPNVIENAQPQRFFEKNNQEVLEVPRSDQSENVSQLRGLLVVSSSESASLKGYEMNLPLKLQQSGLFLPWVLILAFIGGVILNLMPCVFPVLALKVMSLVNLSGKKARHIQAQAWAYTFGVLVSFWILVGALTLFRVLGERVGWGFQLQSPRFIVAMAVVLFGFGLNLLGVFEVSAGSVTGLGDSLTRKEGKLGSFFTGVFATLVATPCTAPFMGTAVGFALSQSVVVSFLIFTVIGVGLAFPYLLLSYLPYFGRYLPKPGLWMESFKQAMAFFVFGTVIWLIWILGLQVQSTAVILLLINFLLIGFATWVIQRWPKSTWKKWVVLGMVGLSALHLVLRVQSYAMDATHKVAAQNEETLHWEAFSPEKLNQYRSEGKPVFLDFTAAWCVSCQVNEMLVFKSEEVLKKIRETGVILMKADWTNQDPVITQTLESFGRSGVPLYVIYGRGKNSPPVVLPEVINASLVLQELNKIK